MVVDSNEELDCENDCNVEHAAEGHDAHETQFGEVSEQRRHYCDYTYIKDA